MSTGSGSRPRRTPGPTATSHPPWVWFPDRPDGRGASGSQRTSPYRDLTRSLRDYVRPLTADGRTIVTVLLPEFVVKKWWHHALHNQNAFEVKLAFLTEPNVIVTSVPYHLE